MRDTPVPKAVLDRATRFKIYDPDTGYDGTASLEDFGLVTATTGPGGGIASLTAGGDALDIGPDKLIIAARTDDAAANTPLVARFTVKAPMRVNSVSGTIAVRANGALVEVSIYGQSGQKLASTEQRECPEVGAFTLSMKETALGAGEYFIVLYCTSGTVTFGVAAQYGGFTAAGAAMPMPETLGRLAPASQVPALTISTATKEIQPLFSDLSSPAFRIYGGETSGKLVGLETSTRKFCYTTNGGINYTVMMPAPVIGEDDGYIDAVATADGFFFLTKKSRIFYASGWTASDAVTEITCPATAGLRRDTAAGRPYALGVFGDHLIWGEYSNSPDELTTHPTDPGGARVLKYGPLSGTPVWSLSKQFDNHRHVHGFLVLPTAVYVVLGDHISTFSHGLWRTTTTDFPNNVWTRWTSMTGSYTRHHPVDITSVGNPGAPIGIYGAGEGDGVMVTFTKMTGSVGSINVDNHTPTPAGVKSTTTYRSIVEHLTGKMSRNLYVFSAETGEDEEPALYCIPVPYVQAYKVCEVPRTVPLTRSFIQNDFLLMFDRRYSVPLMPWQK